MQTELKLTTREQATARSMAVRRKRAQKDFGRAARLSANRFLFRHKDDIITGRDADLLRALTLKLNRLGINATDPADVIVKTRREKNLPDKFAEGERVPRVRQYSHAHIFAAVRMLRHIQDGHAVEKDAMEERLWGVERINSLLVSISKKRLDPEMLAVVKENLRAVADIRRDCSAYKEMAMRKLDNVVRLIELAEQNGSPVMIAAACASLTAFRNRAGEWRARQIEGIDAYSHLRECSLRLRRDHHVASWVGALAEKLAKDPEEASREILGRETAGNALAMLAENMPSGENWRHVVRGKITEIGRQIAKDWRIEKDSPDKKNEPVEIKMLRRLYIDIHAAEFAKEDCTRSLQYIADHFRVRDPSFIAAELEKSNEPYLARTIAELRAGFLCVQNGKPEEAAQHFLEAIRKL